MSSGDDLPKAHYGSDFEDLVAVVTGGASGIGLATARLLAARGAAVGVLDLADPPAGDNEPALSVTCDVTDDRSVQAAIARVVEQLGGLDVVVANAGIGAQGTIEDHRDEDWHRVFDVNVVGTARTLRAALPHLRVSRSPAIVVTCSIASWAGLPRRAVYSASKGALYALTLAMAADHLHDGIRVNGVAPGTVDTPWVERILQAADDPVAERAALEARQPMGRLASADEVALAIAHLASPLSGSTTATILPVDGGMHGLRMPPRRTGQPGASRPSGVDMPDTGSRADEPTGSGPSEQVSPSSPVTRSRSASTASGR